MTNDPGALVDVLSRAGFVAPEEEAAELLGFAMGDPAHLAAALERRLTGEPLAWITGHVTFCGVDILIDPQVYVPRWQTEALTLRAIERLPAGGLAVDLCTGSGAIAKVLRESRRRARICATDIDACALACARRNGVDVYAGDLFAPLPETLRGNVDVVVGVVPYVPTAELPFLQRDTFTFEPALFYDGGADGLDVVRRALEGGTRFLRRGGAMLLEIGGDQAEALTDTLARLCYTDVRVLVDEEGDTRGVETTFAG